MISTERRAKLPFFPRVFPGVAPVLATGLPELDRSLGGGIPLGRLIEISGVHGCGKGSLALRIATGPLIEGKAVIWIDPRGDFFPLPALEAGLPLDRLWVIRLSDPSGRKALQAAQLALSCPGAFALAVLDWPSSRLLPNPSLLKLQHLCESSQASLLFLCDHPPRSPSLGAAIALRFHLHPPGPAGRQTLDILHFKSGPLGRLTL